MKETAAGPQRGGGQRGEEEDGEEEEEAHVEDPSHKFSLTKATDNEGSKLLQATSLLSRQGNEYDMSVSNNYDTSTAD